MNVQLEDITEKKKAILESTLDLIRENGFHGTPMSRIAQVAGVAAGTIYHYFESKDALMLELHLYVKKEMKGAMFQDDNNSIPYKERFFRNWNNLCKYFIRRPSALIFLEQFSCSPYMKLGPAESSGRVTDEFRTAFREFIQYGIDREHIKPMEFELISSVIKGSINATSKFHILSGNCQAKKPDLIEVAKIIWDGIKTGK